MHLSYIINSTKTRTTILRYSCDSCVALFINTLLGYLDCHRVWLHRLQPSYSLKNKGRLIFWEWSHLSVASIKINYLENSIMLYYIYNSILRSEPTINSPLIFTNHTSGTSICHPSFKDGFTIHQVSCISRSYRHDWIRGTTVCRFVVCRAGYWGKGNHILNKNLKVPKIHSTSELLNHENLPPRKKTKKVDAYGTLWTRMEEIS